MVKIRVNLLNAYLEDSPQYNATPRSLFEKHLLEGHMNNNKNKKITVSADNPPIKYPAKYSQKFPLLSTRFSTAQSRSLPV